MKKDNKHEWDGIKKEDNKLPLWLKLIGYGTALFSIFYWLLYPSWPVPNQEGALEWSSDKHFAVEQKEIDKIGREDKIRIEDSSLEEIVKNEKLLKKVLSSGRIAFLQNCSPCHQNDATGMKNYPNLHLVPKSWGDSLQDIYQTIKYGVRSSHDNTRDSYMPGFEDQLSDEEIWKLTDDLLLKRRLDGETFKEYCSSCHGEDGSGNTDAGAPSLIDNIWLYGKSRKEVFDVIKQGRAGVMPAFDNILADIVIKQLAIYIYSLQKATKEENTELG